MIKITYLYKMAMCDDDEDVLLVYLAVNVASVGLVMCKTALEKRSKKKKHRMLAHEYLSFRLQYGAYASSSGARWQQIQRPYTHGSGRF